MGKNITVGFILSLVGISLSLYLCINFLILTYSGYFVFIPLWEQIGILITYVLIFLCLLICILSILGIAVQKHSRAFGIAKLIIASAIYAIALFFTFWGGYVLPLYSYELPGALWTSLVIGSNGLCLILIGSVLYIKRNGEFDLE